MKIEFDDDECVTTMECLAQVYAVKCMSGEITAQDMISGDRRNHPIQLAIHAFAISLEKRGRMDLFKKVFVHVKNGKYEY